MAKKVWRSRAGSVLLAVGLALGATTGAAAEVLRGTGLVVAKDAGEQTVTLSTGAVLHVEGRTRLLDPEGLRLPFGALALAPRQGGAVVADGDATVRYEAVRRGDRLVAETIRVLGTVPR